MTSVAHTDTSERRQDIPYQMLVLMRTVIGRKTVTMATENTGNPKGHITVEDTGLSPRTLQVVKEKLGLRSVSCVLLSKKI